MRVCDRIHTAGKGEFALPLLMLSHAKCMDVSEEEHIVSTAIDGPVKFRQ